MSGRFGHVDRDCTRGRIDPLGLVAIGVALPRRAALVMLGAKKPLTLDLHGQVEHPGKDQPHVLSAALNQLFHQRLKHRIVPLVHSWISIGVS